MRARGTLLCLWICAATTASSVFAQPEVSADEAAASEPRESDTSVAPKFDKVKALPAQPERSGNAVTVNPLALLRSEVGFEYERALGDWFSIYFAPHLTVLMTSNQLEFGLLMETGARVFLLGKPPGGLFVGPLFQLALSREAASGVTRLTPIVGAGAMVGVTFVYFDRLVVSGGIGFRFLRSQNAAESELQALPRLAAGLAF